MARDFVAQDLAAEDMAFASEFGAERASDDPTFTVDLDGFEGPLDLLLELASARRSISRAFRCSRSPTNISPSSRRRAKPGWSSPPTIS